MDWFSVVRLQLFLSIDITGVLMLCVVLWTSVAMVLKLVLL